MVLNDVTNDYKKINKILYTYNTNNSYINSALKLLEQYQSEIKLSFIDFLTSNQFDIDKDNFIKFFNNYEKIFSNQIINMSRSIRNATHLISDIKKTTLASYYVKSKTDLLCILLNNLIDITEEYIANKLKNALNITTFIELINEIEHFKEIYNEVKSNYNSLVTIENELLEILPFEDTDNDITFILDIRSYKPELNISSFSEDLKLLASCLQYFERLVDPSQNSSIYIRKIESGSLKALLGSTKVDFSIFPDLITSISNAIKTWRLTPNEKAKIDAETEKTKAETTLIRAQTEAQNIQNESSKLAIVNSQIDYICEKLQLSKNDPECIEQIQKFCLPLVNYIEHNPIGSFNNVPYDISKEVHLLENQENLESK